MALFGVQSELLSDNLVDQLVKNQIPVLKTINLFDRRLLSRYKNSVPHSKLYPRLWVDDTDLTQKAETIAQQVADRTSRALDPIQDLVDSTFFLNESLQQGAEITKLSDATIAYCDIMEPRGYQVIGGDFGVGNPPVIKDILRFAPALRRLKRWSRHAYGAPSLMTPDPASYMLRHRLEHTMLLTLKDPTVIKPLILGECGIDGGVLGTDHKEQGYHSFNVTPPNYNSQFSWLKMQLDFDPPVETVLVFGFGLTNQWRFFDICPDPEILVHLGSLNPKTLDIGPGFRAWQKLEPDIIGEFLRNEDYNHTQFPAEQISFCWTTKGLLRWIGLTGEMDFWNKADRRIRKYMKGSPRWLW